MYDIVFLSYDEMYADENYSALKRRYPRASRVHGVKGIFEAHLAAARQATTDMFYIVDADALVVPDFNFDTELSSYDYRAVHVWHSRNPINNLEYGYGGVKLFPRDLLVNFTGSPIDFTTTVSSKFKVVPKVSNITRFNTDPFSAWRSGFRECAKLSASIIKNEIQDETKARLDVWMTIGEENEFGDFAIMGAKEGYEFGSRYKNEPDMLRLINDFEWLERRFTS